MGDTMRHDGTSSTARSDPIRSGAVFKLQFGSPAPARPRGVTASPGMGAGVAASPRVPIPVQLPLIRPQPSYFRPFGPGSTPLASSTSEAPVTTFGMPQEAIQRRFDDLYKSSPMPKVLQQYASPAGNVLPRPLPVSPMPVLPPAALRSVQRQSLSTMSPLVRQSPQLQTRDAALFVRPSPAAATVNSVTMSAALAFKRPDSELPFVHFPEVSEEQLVHGPSLDEAVDGANAMLPPTAAETVQESESSSEASSGSSSEVSSESSDSDSNEPTGESVAERLRRRPRRKAALAVSDALLASHVALRPTPSKSSSVRPEVAPPAPQTVVAIPTPVAVQAAAPAPGTAPPAGAAAGADAASSMAAKPVATAAPTTATKHVAAAAPPTPTTATKQSTTAAVPPTDANTATKPVAAAGPDTATKQATASGSKPVFGLSGLFRKAVESSSAVKLVMAAPAPVQSGQRIGGLSSLVRKAVPTTVTKVVVVESPAKQPQTAAPSEAPIKRKLAFSPPLSGSQASESEAVVVIESQEKAVPVKLNRLQSNAAAPAVSEPAAVLASQQPAPQAKAKPVQAKKQQQAAKPKRKSEQKPQKVEPKPAVASAAKRRRTEEPKADEPKPEVPWTRHQDAELLRLCKGNDAIDWDHVVSRLRGKTLDACKMRWQTILAEQESSSESESSDESADSDSDSESEPAPPRQHAPKRNGPQAQGKGARKAVASESESESSDDEEVIDSNSDDSADGKRWSEQEIHKLHVAVGKLPPLAPNFWQVVAAQLPGRTVEECQTQWHGPSPAIVKRKARAADMDDGKLGGKGTMKRRRQLRALANQRVKASASKLLKRRRGDDDDEEDDDDGLELGPEFDKAWASPDAGDASSGSDSGSSDSSSQLHDSQISASHDVLGPVDHDRIDAYMVAAKQRRLIRATTAANKRAATAALPKAAPRKSSSTSEQARNVTVRGTLTPGGTARIDVVRESNGGFSDDDDEEVIDLTSDVE